MPITETFMDGAPWSVTLMDDTPRWVLDAIDVRTRLWASIVITPHHIGVGDVADATLLSLARYVGVYLGMGAGRTSLRGEGLIWWLGQDGDGGDLHASEDFEYGTGDTAKLTDAVTDLIFNGSNGLTEGSVAGPEEYYTVQLEGGDTKREVLDTLMSKSGDLSVWKLTPEGVLSIGTPASLWPTTTTPTVMLTPDGGQDAVVAGVFADFVAAELNGDDVRNDVFVDWQDGVNNGRALLSTPSGWKNFAGGTPVVRTLIDWRPKRPRPPTERWRKLAAWQIRSETTADKMAARELNERSEVRQEIVVEVDEYDPWRWAMSPGNWVYLWDPDTGVIDTTREVYYRGDVTHPDLGRVDQWTTPIQDGYGVYIRYWNGSSFTYYDLTNWVEPEDGATKLTIGHRDRFAPKMVARRPSKLKKKRIRRAALAAARQQVLATTNQRRPISAPTLWAPNSARAPQRPGED